MSHAGTWAEDKMCIDYSVVFPEAEAPRELRDVLHATARFGKHLAAAVPPPRLYLVADKARKTEWYYARSARVRLMKLPGVYIHFAVDGSVIYVGKAIAGSVRPLDQCWKIEKRKPAICAERRWIYTMTFAQTWEFLAPSLELYLISRFAPKYNSNDMFLSTPDFTSRKIENLKKLVADLKGGKIAPDSI